MPKTTAVFFLVITFCLSVQAQKPTVGLTFTSDKITDAYTLFSPAASKNVYLINNCGDLVHEWNTAFMPGQAIKLKDNGDLVRTGRIDNDNFNDAGGLGGRIETLDWDGKVKWGYNYSSPTHTGHHDMCVLPNGNILLMIWELKTISEGVAAGRKAEYIPHKGLWTEQLIEFKPVGTDSAVIVWKWDVWDHLVQDLDSTKANYGVVADHPEKIDVNYNKVDHPCWVHFNSVDYNAELNQVMVSSRAYSEIWIIDHDTAATGNSKSDLLFRYGNPAAYNRGTAADAKLFYQHDARWVKCGTKYEDAIMVFNNGTTRPAGQYSTIETWLPGKNNEGKYAIQSNGTYNATSLWVYNENNKHGRFFSRRISSVDLLPNGHVRVCSGNEGRFFEIDEQENIVWQYICPISLGGIPVSQGEKTPFVINSVFKTEILLPDHPALAGKDLSPKGTVEKNPIKRDCNPHADVAHAFSIDTGKSTAEIILHIPGYNGRYGLKAYDAQGNAVAGYSVSANMQPIDISEFKAGAYQFVLTDSEGYTTCSRFMKLPD